jgi:predicted Zn-dependent protease
MNRRDIVRGLAAGTLMLAAAGCETNPTTGRSQLMLVDDAQLATLSLDAWAQEKKNTPISKDPAMNARLQRVGRRIADVSGLQNQQWEFVVFDKDEKNAFVLPGGKVGFYKGLMNLADKDDHIACVIGHEVGHVQGRHAAERYSQGLAQQAGLAAASATKLGGSQLGMAALGLGLQVGVALPYSRFQEVEADRVGVDNMHRAQYDVRESVAFWQKMAASSAARQPSILSTHPSPESRIADLRAYINQRGYAQM